VFQEHPELSGIIMEINDLRGFDRHVGRKQRPWQLQATPVIRQFLFFLAGVIRRN
jgi:hypothetical protein